MAKHKMTNLYCNSLVEFVYVNNEIGWYLISSNKFIFPFSNEDGIPFINLKEVMDCITLKQLFQLGS